MKSRIVQLISVSLLAASVAASAEPVTYEFTGVVTLASGTYSSIAAGSAVTGTYTFDLASGVPSQGTGVAGDTSNGWIVQSYGGPIYTQGPSSLPTGLVFALTFNVAGFSYGTPAIGGTGVDSYVSTYQIPAATNVHDAFLGPPNTYQAQEVHYYDSIPYDYSTSIIDLFGQPYGPDGMPVFSLATSATGELDMYSGTANGFGSESSVDYTITSLTPFPNPPLSRCSGSALPVPAS